jgi:intracellular sulfur oxidation DsrE/DsrF family protein
MSKIFPSSPERRSFLTYANAGIASVAALVAGGDALAQDKPAVTPPPAPHWEPARHAKDDWLDIPAKHRLVFDTTTPDRLGDALAFANNYIRVNRVDYGVESGDLAVILVMRHNSTSFAYSDAIWGKYGSIFAKEAKLLDPKTGSAPKINIYNANDYGDALPNRNTPVAALVKQGVHFAVCSSATRLLASMIARASGGTTTIDAAYNELVASIAPGAQIVPAGIVAVNRAQERGYSLVKS